VAAKYVVGVDIGGTFTDIMLLGADRLHKMKLLSTTPDYSLGVMQGIRNVVSKAGIDIKDIDVVVHGTTVATNAVLENAGAKTGLITTKGFRDILELRMTRPKRDRLRGYVTDLITPKPLVPRFLRLEVDERINHRGEIIKPLGSEDVEKVVEELVDEGVEAIAVCLLNSFENDVHEKLIGDHIHKNYPQLFLSLSSKISPLIREYDRTSTTVINSYVGPKIRYYLDLMVERLQAIGIRAPLLLVESGGSIIGAKLAAERPMHIIESGPSAGVRASHSLAGKYNQGNVITLDMGGTTTKASMIENGEIRKIYKYSLGGGMNVSTGELGGEGYPLSAPTIDISEIGAGGGSIISIDAGGLVKVGPKSSGSIPGPACYNQGGTRPTLTDANVVLGYLGAQSLVGGDLQLDVSKAQVAIEDCLAKPLGLSIAEAAMGAYRIAISNMTRAVKSISTERGRDLREYTLLAFGGSGPVYAVELARALNISQVIIPPAAGIFSALGLSSAEIESNLSISYIRPLKQVDVAEFELEFRRLERDVLSILAGDKYGKDEVTFRRHVDICYKGTSTLTIPLRVAGKIDAATVANLKQDFCSEYVRTYATAPSGRDIELMALRATGKVEKAESWDPFSVGKEQREKLAEGELLRKVYFGEGDGYSEHPVLKRTDLSAKYRSGPFLVEDYDTTTVVPPGSQAYLDQIGSIRIEVYN